MRRPTPRPVLAALTAALALAVGWSATVPAAAGGRTAATPRWAPAATATIHPGVQTVTAGSQCTSNFVFTDGRSVYLGQAAHCAGTGGSTATNGCTSPSLPLGTRVQIAGASRPGVLVYSSWLTMQRLHERNANTCQYNDFALVRLDPADVRRVNPSVPFWGGPTGLATAGGALGAEVFSFGNSELRLGASALSPKVGVEVAGQGGGWSHLVYTATPGIPGDSGSAFLDSNGRALGILSTLTLAPLAGSNGVGDLAHELTYLHAHTPLRAVTLVRGTEPFGMTPVLG